MHTRVASLLFMPAVVFGWGNDGHRLIGDLAEVALASNPAVMARVHELFGPDVHLRDLAVCADRVRYYVRSTSAPTARRGLRSTHRGRLRSRKNCPPVIHQPLHAADRNQDQGGRRFPFCSSQTA